MNKTHAIAFFIAGVAAGGVGGYFLARKKAEAYYRDISDSEIASMQNRQRLVRLEDGSWGVAPAPWDEGHVDTLKEGLENLGYTDSGAINIPVDAPVKENIFDKDEPQEEEIVIDSYDGDSWEGEDVDPLPPRVSGKPYVISLQEFMEEEEEFDKLTITYFEKDEALTDERDQLVPDIDAIVGSYSLTRFGYRSDSPDVVYVRNENISCDFEICRETGSFSETILGLEEPKDKHVVRKMRQEDD